MSVVLAIVLIGVVGVRLGLAAPAAGWTICVSADADSCMSSDTRRCSALTSESSMGAPEGERARPGEVSPRSGED